METRDASSLKATESHLTDRAGLARLLLLVPKDQVAVDKPPLFAPLREPLANGCLVDSFAGKC